MREPSLQADCGVLFDPHRLWLMGVLNITPDSFYPDSRFQTVDHAVAHAKQLIDDGADVLDIGGESTRPGAGVVAIDEELKRVIPVIQALREQFPRTLISVDTQKAEVARQAFEHGASLLNDISALRDDPKMPAVAAHARAPVILMHMQGTPKTMQKNPQYDDVVGEVAAFFEARIAFAVRSGIDEANLILDPGIGFGKSLAHNVALLKGLQRLHVRGRPLVVGVSRKSFLGRLSSRDPSAPLPAEDRLEGSLAAGLWAAHHGANGLRVHDVGATRRALCTWRAIEETTA